MYRWLLILLLVLVPSRVPLRAADAAFSAEFLRGLPDAELLKTYETTALAAGATDAGLAQGNPADRDRRTGLVKAEILRRGGGLVPPLVDMLRNEVATERPLAGRRVRPSLAGDEIQLLVRLGDSRAVGPLLDLASTPPVPGAGRPDRISGLRPLSAVEEITFTSFLQTKPHHANYETAVQHPNALDLEFYSRDDYPAGVRLYRDWLAGEGHDPGQWLSLAQKRARDFLDGDDLDAVYCAASFLSGTGRRGLQTFPRDDAPDRTLRRLGQILAGSTRVVGGKPSAYQYQGKPLPVTIFNWVGLLTEYGPRARPWAGVLIRLQREFGLDNWSGLWELSKVGGTEVMAFYFDALPAVSERADAIHNDPATPKGFAGDDPRFAWLQSQDKCRVGIDRWAGQQFESDALRAAWWDANRGKPPEVWLRESLPVAVRLADSPMPYHRWIFHQLLPDAPYGSGEALPRDSAPTTLPEPFRQKWFDDHRAELVYDPDAGAFRLPAVPAC